MVGGRVLRARERFLTTRLCVLCACWLVALPALAEPLRAVMRLSEPGDAALLSRVRGQTDDLDVQLEAVERAPLEASFAAQLEAARTLAGERDARAVTWAVRDARGLRLIVADFALDRVLVREIAASALERSAQEEAAAMVVRSALRASLAGSALGAPSAQLLSAPAREEVESEPAPTPAPAKQAALVTPARALDVQLELGVLSGIDGVSRHGHHVLDVRAGLRVNALEVALLGGAGLPSPVSSELASLSLSGHRLEASAGWAPRSERVEYALFGATALHVFRIDAAARDARLETRTERELLASLVVFARLTFLPRAWDGAGLTLRIGCDVFPRALELGYEDNGFVRVRRQWSVQPHLGIGLIAF